MENIVAVEVALENGEKRYFLTWGRIQSTVDTTSLESLIFEHSVKFALGGVPVRARVCQSLQEASREPYFYECFFVMCQEKIPFGTGYRQWKDSMATAMEHGKELYFLGAPEDQEREPSPGLIAYGKDSFTS